MSQTEDIESSRWSLFPWDFGKFEHEQMHYTNYIDKCVLRVDVIKSNVIPTSSKCCDQGATWCLPKCKGEGWGCGNIPKFLCLIDILSPYNIGGTIHHNSSNGDKRTWQWVSICKSQEPRHEEFDQVIDSQAKPWAQPQRNKDSLIGESWGGGTFSL